MNWEDSIIFFLCKFETLRWQIENREGLNFVVLTIYNGSDHLCSKYEPNTYGYLIFVLCLPGPLHTSWSPPLCTRSDHWAPNPLHTSWSPPLCYFFIFCSLPKFYFSLLRTITMINANRYIVLCDGREIYIEKKTRISYTNKGLQFLLFIFSNFFFFLNS